MGKIWKNLARYWEEPDAGASLAVCRIALHCMAVITLIKYTGGLEQFPAFPGEYHPKGLLALVSPKLPSAEALQAGFVICLVASSCAVLGLFYRLSAVLSLVSGVLIGGFLESAAPGRWSHALNILYIVQIAFVFAPAGDVFSFDNLMRRVLPASRYILGTERRPLTRKFVYLGQFAAASMFFSAFFWKINTSGIEWAFSDNMRHILAVQYPLLGVEYPSLILWIASHKWIYQTVAVGNLVCQALPMAACFVVRYPRLRALLGFMLVLETFGLLVIMRLNDLHFLFLYAFFVDWDRLLAWNISRIEPLRRRWEVWSADWNFGLASPVIRVASLSYALSFIGLVALISFNPWQRHLDYKWNTYPFTAFAMYSYMHAAEPFDQHLPYGRRSITVDLKEFDGSTEFEMREERLAKFRHQERYAQATTLAQLRAACTAVSKHLENRQLKYREFQVLRTFDQIPAYPELPHPKPVKPGLMCQMTAGGEFTGVAIDLKFDRGSSRHYIEVSASPDIDPELVGLSKVEYIVDMLSETEALPGEWIGDKFFPSEELPKGAISFVLRLPGRAGGVAYHSRLFYR